MSSCHGFVVWVRIMGSYHRFVSPVRTMCSSIGSCHGFVPWIRIMGPIMVSYHGLVLGMRVSPSGRAINTFVAVSAQIL